MFRWFMRLTFVALVGIVAVGFLGKHRVHRCLDQARHSLQSAVDSAIDPGEEAKLRRRLESVQQLLPGRIAEMQVALAEVDGELAALERDAQLCRRVVAFCERDLEALEASVDAGPALKALQLEEIARVKATYEARLEQGRAAAHDLGEERTMIAQALSELEAEQARLDWEARRLEREIDQLRRNGRLIEVLEANRIAREDAITRADLDSLRRVRAAIAEKRAAQDVRLQELRRRRLAGDYEARALLPAPGSRTEIEVRVQ